METTIDTNTPQISSETYVSIKIRQLWVIISCTVVGCLTIYGVYDDLKDTIQQQGQDQQRAFELLTQKNEADLRLINMRLDRLERDQSFKK